VGPWGKDLTLFPFDTQFCELQYGSVADSARRVNYTLMGPGNPYADSVVGWRRLNRLNLR
jgi:hypothetical protein